MIRASSSPGGSSGIGTELARGLGRLGYPPVLVARRRERLIELADELREKYAVRVDILPLDLADDTARAELVDRIGRDPVAGLCNSAGFGTSGPFRTLPPEREKEELVLNALALVELTRAALPGMVDRGAGAILNVASAAAFQPMPGMAVYSAQRRSCRRSPKRSTRNCTEPGCRARCCAPVPCPPNGPTSPTHNSGVSASYRSRLRMSPKPRSKACSTESEA